MPSAAALLAMISFLSNARLWRSAGRRVTGKTAGHLVATDWLRIDLARAGETEGRARYEPRLLSQAAGRSNPYIVI